MSRKKVHIETAWALEWTDLEPEFERELHLDDERSGIKLFALRKTAMHYKRLHYGDTKWCRPVRVEVRVS